MSSDDSDSGEGDGNGQNLEAMICVLFQSNSCLRNKNTCDFIHTKYPFLWQSQINGQWNSFPEFHSIELEKVFRIASLDGTQISAIDPATNQQFFDPAQTWYARFDEMFIQQGNLAFNIRRLSTISSKISSSKMATEFEWYVQDQRNQWTKYGEVNVENLHQPASSATLMDLEHYYSFEEVDSVDITSFDNEFLIDFVLMTQTNRATMAVRKLRRRVKNGALVAGIGPTADYTDMTAIDRVMMAATPAVASSNTIGTGAVSAAEMPSVVSATAAAITPVAAALPFSATPSVAATMPFVTASMPTSTIAKPPSTVAMQHVAAAMPPAASAQPSVSVALTPVATLPVVVATQSVNNTAAVLSTMDFTSPSAVGAGTLSASPSVMSTVTALLAYVSGAVIAQARSGLWKLLSVITDTGSSFFPSASSAPYIWQFQDKHGAWIEYGSSSTNNDQRCVTSASSDDIEKQFTLNPTGSVAIQSHLHQYVLDFQNMTQTNHQTGVVRHVRRIQRNQNTVQQIVPSFVASPAASNTVSNVWQFQDEHGAWITYGNPNTNCDQSCLTTANSDHIESYFAMNPTASIAIQSLNNHYVLDFQNMTQTNQQTGVVRVVRRVTQPNPVLPAWWLQDNYY